MNEEYTIKDFKREMSESSPAKIYLIPTYIGRQISSSFDWDYRHGGVVFSGAAREKLGILEQIINYPHYPVNVELEPVKQAIFDEFKNLRHRIQIASEEYSGPEPDSFDLRLCLGDSYTSIGQVFLTLIELVEHLQSHEEQELEAKRKKILEMVGVQPIKLGYLASLIKERYYELMSNFRNPGPGLEFEIKSFLSFLQINKEQREQWSFNKDGIDYKIIFGDKILGSRRLWFKRDRVCGEKGIGLARLLRLMVANSKHHGGAKEITLTFFTEYDDKPIGNNFGLSVEDSGKGFDQVACLAENQPILQFAKEYRDALVIVESKGRACWYVVGESGVNRCERPTDYQQTKATLLLPIDNGYDYVWNLVRKSFNEQELIDTRFDEAENIRKRKRDNGLAILKFSEILKRVEGKDEKYAQNKVAQCHHRIGNCYVHLGQLEKARKHHEKAELLLEALAYQKLLDPPEERWWFYNSVSVAYTDHYDYETAEQYIKKSIQFKEFIADSRVSLAQSQGSLGQLYTFWGRYDEAENVLKEAVEGMKIELNEVKKELERGTYRGPDAHNEVLSDLMRDENYLALLYIKTGRFQEAESIFDENLSLNESAPLDDMKAFNAIYIYYGKSKLYYYWGLAEGKNDRFKEAVSAAEKGLSFYAPKYSGWKDPYPGSLMQKFKGCALRELASWDDAIVSLKESYSSLEASESKSICVIAAASRLELAKLHLARNEANENDPQNATLEITKAIDGIKAFNVDSAQRYFSSSIENLSSAIQQVMEGNLAEANKLIQAAIDRIPY